jgi:hypothetical protein
MNDDRRGRQVADIALLLMMMGVVVLVMMMFWAWLR